MTARSRVLGEARRLVHERRRRAMFAASPWFDEEFYRSGNPDAGEIDPLTHFLRHGEPEGRDPHPDFDTDAYVLVNPAAAGRALTHFLETVAAAPGDVGPLRPADIFDATAPVLSDGWFEPAWYVEHHELTDRRLHPYVHYRRVGAASGLSPGPLLDGPDYETHHEPAALGVDAITHWTEQQPDVGPLTVEHPFAGHQLWPRARHRIHPRRRLEQVRTCVMLHAFYVDLLPWFLERLRHLPPGFTLLVSVTDPQSAAEAHRAVDAVLGSAQPRTVKIVPNRGRNFAPLLCSFREEVLDHEIVLHLHTKKSLYSGDELVSWREHLVDHLLPSPAGVDAVISHFVEVPTTGIVQAPPYSGIAHWANHWLGNVPHGRALLARMGLDPAAARGYLDYPVGGMFWARTAALGPLFSLDLLVGDFEREAGQTDGTLAHAIERVVPASARAADMTTVEIDVPLGEWRVGWSTRNRDAFGRLDVDELEEWLERAELVTVDLFDTLLLRPSLDPDTLRAAMIARELAGTMGDPAELLQHRIDAETALRRERPELRDVTLREIYDEATRQRPERADDLRRLRTAETAIERRAAVPRRWLIDLLRSWRTPERRFVLMTDTYLDRPTIDLLLAHIGADDLFDDVYVSNEARARKDAGTMWELVGTMERTEHWLHIGDNEASDIQQASDRGVWWIHVPAPGAVAQFGGLDVGALPADRRPATSLVAGSALAALAADQPVRERRPATVDEFGYGVVGPITFAFVNWLIRRSRSDGIDRLLFIARDGYLAFRALERFRPLLGDDVPPADYFLMSRRAALSISQHRGADVAGIVDAGDFNGSVGDLLHARIGWRPDDPALARRAVTLPRDRDELLGLLEPYGPHLEAAGRRDRAAFERYHDLLGLAAGHVALIDLGYSATTQRLLAPEIGARLSGYYYVTTPAADAVSDVHACFARGATGRTGHFVFDHQRVFELVCAADHPQVERLADGHGGLVAITDPRTAAGDRERAMAERVQRAALRFVADLVDLHGPELLDAPLDPVTVLGALERSVGPLVPSPDVVFDGYVLDDHFCGNESLPLNRAAR